MLTIRNMLHWDQMSFLRERGEKILAKKQTLETTMDMEVAHTLPWRWTINAVVAAMTILLLLSCVALCVCVSFFWLQMAGLSIRMSSETHTHNLPIDHRLRSVSNAATPQVSKSSVRRR